MSGSAGCTSVGAGGGLKRRGSSHMFSGRGCHDGSLSSFRRRKQVGLIERGGFRASCRPLPWARSVSLTVSYIYQKGSSSLLLGQRPAPFQAPSLADAWGRETSSPRATGHGGFCRPLSPWCAQGLLPSWARVFLLFAHKAIGRFFDRKAAGRAEGPGQPREGPRFMG